MRYFINNNIKKTKQLTPNKKTSFSRIKISRKYKIRNSKNKQIIMDSSPNGNPFSKAAYFSNTESSENGSKQTNK